MDTSLAELNGLMGETLPATGRLYPLDPYPGYLLGPDCPNAHFLRELRSVTDGWVYLTWFRPIGRWMLRQICKDGVHRDLTILQDAAGNYLPPDRRVFFWLGAKDSTRTGGPEKTLKNSRERRQKRIDHARSELKGELAEGRHYVMAQPKSFTTTPGKQPGRQEPIKVVEKRRGEQWSNIGPRVVVDAGG